MQKIIHYFYDDIDIWKRNNSPTFRICYASWLKFCPDYEIKLWHTGMPEFQEILKQSKFVRECYKRKMWAFIADYIRHYALFHYGGIYLDTDVQLLKNFDDFLDKPFFCSIEGDIYKGNNITESAVLGGEKGHIFFKEMLDIYNSDEIFSINYLIDPIVLSEYLRKKIGFTTIPYTNNKYSELYAREYSKKDYGPLANYELYLNQTIFYDAETGAEIYPCEYFCPAWFSFAEKAFTDKTVSIHWNQSSWWKDSAKNMREIQSFRYKNPVKRWLYINLLCLAKLAILLIPNKDIRKKIRNYLTR